MRTLQLLALGVLFVVSTELTVTAQTPEQQPQAPPAPQTPAQPTPQPEPGPRTPRFFFDVSVGGQSKEQTFTDSSTFDIYTEKGAVASAHSIGGGTLFNGGVGARVWKNLSVGVAYSTVLNRNEATVAVRVPHPLVFGQFRDATATTSALEHSENVVHLQFIWTIPLMNKFDLSVMAGPSFFTVRQTIATVQAPADIRDVPPFSTVTITQLSLTDVKDSPVGVNVGIDGRYAIRTIFRVGIGIGGFVRYSGASLDLPITPGLTRDTTLKAGGPQAGAGLRLRF